MSKSSGLSGIKDQMMGAVDGGLKKLGNWMYKERDSTAGKVGMVAFRVFFWISIAGLSIAIMSMLNGNKIPIIHPVDLSDPLKLMGLLPLGSILSYSVAMVFFEALKGEKNKNRARLANKVMSVVVPVLCAIVVLGALSHIIKGASWGVNQASSGSIWRTAVPSAILGAAIIPMVAGIGYLMVDRCYEAFRRERRTITMEEYIVLRRLAAEAQERRIKAQMTQF